MRIAIDWAGTIIREKDIFEKLSNGKEYFGPKSWDEYFPYNISEKEYKTFMSNSELYPGSLETVNNLNGGNLGPYAKDQLYIIFDDKPRSSEVSNPQKNLLFNKKINDFGMEPDGTYINSDKLSLYKSISLDLAIDDDPRICMSLAFSGIKSILILRKWNRNFSKDILDIVVPEQKLEKIKNNMFFAEDFSETLKIIKRQKGNKKDEIKKKS